MRLTVLRGETMAQYDYSEKDLEQAAEFRAGIHKEALAKARKIRPDIESVIDRNPVDAYFCNVWEYPGKWYLYVSIPEGFSSRDALVDSIVRDTLELYRRKTITADKLQKENSEVYFSQAEDYICPDDPFYDLLVKYPDCVVDYCIVTCEGAPYRGCESHWQALAAAGKKIIAASGFDRCDVNKARGKRIDPGELFSSDYKQCKLNYRRAFLYPPYENGYTGKDFAKVNAALFPNGTADLEVFEWTTDWSDYFDEGHEWWGALCLTVYDKSAGRFVVITASASD